MKDRITPADPIPVLQESAPPRELPRRTEALTHEVVVNFYRRMKMNRVFPLEVQLKRHSDKRAGALASTSPVQIRPVIPGAHVMPALREVHLGDSDAVSTFHVTPLAKGRLRDARVGIYQDGRLLQEVQLPMNGARQRMTWILLALTFLIPGLIRYFTVGVDLSQSGTSTKFGKAEALAQKRMPRANEETDIQAPQKKVGGKAPTGLVAADTRSPLEKEMGEKMKAGMGGMGRGAGAASEPASTTKPAVAQPPQRLGFWEHEITENTPEPSEVIPFLPAIREPVARGVQDVYEFVQGFEKYNTNAGILELDRQPLSRYLFVVLLVLTVTSWILHRSVRARRRAVPVSLAA